MLNARYYKSEEIFVVHALILVVCPANVRLFIAEKVKIIQSRFVCYYINLLIESISTVS